VALFFLDEFVGSSGTGVAVHVPDVSAGGVWAGSGLLTGSGELGAASGGTLGVSYFTGTSEPPTTGVVTFGVRTPSSFGVPLGGTQRFGITVQLNSKTHGWLHLRETAVAGTFTAMMQPPSSGSSVSLGAVTLAPNTSYQGTVEYSPTATAWHVFGITYNTVGALSFGQFAPQLETSAVLGGEYLAVGDATYSPGPTVFVPWWKNYVLTSES
jgi:hypothetical protein